MKAAQCTIFSEVDCSDIAYQATLWCLDPHCLLSRLGSGCFGWLMVLGNGYEMALGVSTAVPVAWCCCHSLEGSNAP